VEGSGFDINPCTAPAFAYREWGNLREASSSSVLVIIRTGRLRNESCKRYRWANFFYSFVVGIKLRPGLSVLLWSELRPRGAFSAIFKWTVEGSGHGYCRVLSYYFPKKNQPMKVADLLTEYARCLQKNKAPILLYQEIRNTWYGLIIDNYLSHNTPSWFKKSMHFYASAVNAPNGCSWGSLNI
jgi:hypothetical protein